MAQHDYNLANQTFPSMRTDMNNALTSIVSQNSGSSAPSTTFSYMFWADTTNALLKQRNAANDGWITIWPLDNTGGQFKTHSANPNGAIAGDFVGQPCLDTTAGVLYICTTVGNSSTAVWSTDYTVSTGGGGIASKRNTVLAGATSAGAPAVIGEGSGLVPQFLGNTTSGILSFAAGFDENGPVEYFSELDSDENFPTLTDEDTNYLYIERSSVDGSLSTGATVIAPVYKTSAPGTKAALLHFNNNVTDEYGDASWTNNGSTPYSSGTKKFGSHALDFSNDVTDYISTTDIDVANYEEWTVEFWINTKSNSAALYGTIGSSGTTASTMSWGLFQDNRQFGLGLSADGSNKFYSSKGSVADHFVAGTWSHVALCFSDSTYSLFVDGKCVITTPGPKLYAAGGIAIGKENTYNGGTADAASCYLDEFRFTPWNRYGHTTAGTTLFTPPSSELSTETITVHWFDTTAYKFYEGNAEDGWTEKQIIFVGEADCTGSDVSAVRSYAFKGYKEVEQTTLTVGTKYTLNHLLGTHLVNITPYLECKTTDGDYLGPNKLFNLPQNGVNGISCVNTGRNTMAFTVGATSLGSIADLSDGTAHTMTASKWAAKAIVERSF